MEFEWDEDKREANLVKHGIDFAQAITIWSGQVIDPSASRVNDGETRYLALGAIGNDDLVIAVVYTLRDDVRRVISARRGRRNERTNYKSQFGRGT
jgi:uncharacterized DUF497 family protein